METKFPENDFLRMHQSIDFYKNNFIIDIQTNVAQG